jgi:Glycosyltransferase family 87
MLQKERTKNIILGILLLALLFELVRSCFRAGDFIGYINAGNLTLSGQNIYSDYLNTWPPFFSVFSVPLALIDRIHPVLIRTLWLILSAVAFFWTMRISVRWLHQKQLLLPFQKEEKGTMLFSNLLVFVPFIIMVRFILDNFANVQINILLLWSSILVIDWYIKGKYSWAGLLLALSISLKVYPVFLLLYFVFKREFSLVGWTILFLFLFNSIPFLVYGQETATAYYLHWWNEIASPYASVQHKNQSFFSMLRSLLRHESPGLGIYLNVVDVSLEQLKKIAYGIIILGALFPMYLFRNKLEDKQNEIALLEYAFVLTAIPILSPLAWKAYFIYLWPAYFLIYYYLYFSPINLGKQKRKILQAIYILSIILNVFSTDLFVGPYVSDVFECFSSITIGTLLLLFLLLTFYVQLRKE